VEINTSAPVVVCKEIKIRATAEEVWRIHTNITGWKHWHPDVSESKLEGELAVGAVFNWKSRGTKITSTIRELEPNRRIVWSGKAGGASAIHAWTIEPNGEGVVLKTEESLEGMMVGLMKGGALRKLETSLEGWLIDLKNEVEMESNGKN